MVFLDLSALPSDYNIELKVLVCQLSSEASRRGLSMQIAESESDAVAPFPVRKFSKPEYQLLGKLGVLSVDDRVELLEGWIVPKMNHNPPHDLALMLVEEKLRCCLPSNMLLRIQMPISTVDSEPEPDLAIVLGPIRRYSKRHPEPDDVLLVIEVADTSLARDRQKCRLYARGNMREYWIVNLVERQIEVHCQPSGPTLAPTYRIRDVYDESCTISFATDGAAAFPIQVRDLLP